MPLGRLAGVAAGDPVRAKGGAVLVPTGAGLFGRVLDGLGRPIDGKGPLLSGPRVPIDNEAPERHETRPDRHRRCRPACASWTP